MRSNYAGVMTIACLSRYGVIFLKGESTLRSVERLKRWKSRVVEDDHLIGFSIASSGQDLEAANKTLREEGCTHGVDYVLTASDDGVLDPLPSWLEVSLAPTGNPPELEATMEPEVRAMWERTRQKVYSYVAA